MHIALGISAPPPPQGGRAVHPLDERRPQDGRGVLSLPQVTTAPAPKPRARVIAAPPPAPKPRKRTTAPAPAPAPAPKPPTKVSLVLDAIERLGPIGTPELSVALGMATQHIWGLMKPHLWAGRVEFESRLWRLAVAQPRRTPDEQIAALLGERRVLVQLLIEVVHVCRTCAEKSDFETYQDWDQFRTLIDRASAAINSVLTAQIKGE